MDAWQLAAKRTFQLESVRYTIHVYKFGGRFIARWRCLKCAGYHNESPKGNVDTAVSAAQDSVEKHHAEHRI